jgi:hypothetical protein
MRSLLVRWGHAWGWVLCEFWLSLVNPDGHNPFGRYYPDRPNGSNWREVQRHVNRDRR